MSVSQVETEIGVVRQNQQTTSLTDVYWMEQTQTDLPDENQWLSARERHCLSGLVFLKRRTDWRLGRWTAKRALAACLNLPTDLPSLANIEIRATASGAPEVLLFNHVSPFAISLSHSNDTAMCTVARSATKLGCDLEVIEPRTDAFVTDYFTDNEQQFVERAPTEERPLLVTLIWSAKESALKALREGLRLDTNCVDVNPFDAPAQEEEEGWQDPSGVPLLTGSSDQWRPLCVRYAGAQVFSGWWRRSDHLVRTVVSIPPLRPPVHLEPSRCA